MFKLIATDMDGTFLDSQGQFDGERFKRLLAACKEKGIYFVLASGRSYLGLEWLFEDYKEDLVFLVENGSLVMVKDEVYVAEEMPKELYLSVLRHLEEGKFGQQVGWLVSGRKAGYVSQTASQDYMTQIQPYYGKVERVADFEHLADRVFKVTVNLPENQVHKAAHYLHEAIPGVTAMVTGFTSIDIIRDDVDKQTGLAQLGQRLGIAPEEMVAFGDNLNDLEMLGYVGLSVAPANAREEIKAIADVVIGDHDTGAVLAYMEEIVHGD